MHCPHYLSWGQVAFLRNPLFVLSFSTLYLMPPISPAHTHPHTHPSETFFWPQVTFGFSLLPFHPTSRLSKAPPLWPVRPWFWTRPSCFRTGACQPDRAGDRIAVFQATGRNASAPTQTLQGVFKCPQPCA